MRRSRRAPQRREVIDTGRLRAALIERFGELYSEEATYIDERVTRCCFWDGAAGSRVVYVTLGAANTPARGELLLVSALPYHKFEVALGALACEKVRREPLQIVASKIEDSPFESALFAPPEDGSLPLGGSGDGEERAEPVWALRVVPITGAEHLLGRDDPERLLALLREHGALVADPLRDCVLEPARTRYFRRIVRPLLVDSARRRVKETRTRTEQFIQMNAPAEFIKDSKRLLARHQVVLDHLERNPDAGPDRRSDKVADMVRESVTHSVQMVEDEIGPFERILPENITERLRELLWTVLCTHPQATPLLEEVAATAAGIRPSPAAPLSADEIVDRLASAVFKSSPKAELAELVARGRRAAIEARESFDPKHEIPIDCAVWYGVHVAVYRDVHEPDSPLAHAFRHGADTAMILVDPDVNEDPRPPVVQLRESLKNIVMAAFMGLSTAVGPRHH